MKWKKKRVRIEKKSRSSIFATARGPRGKIRTRRQKKNRITGLGSGRSERKKGCALLKRSQDKSA